MKYRVRVNQSKPKEIIVHPNTAASFNLQNGKKIKLGFGLQHLKVSVKISKGVKQNELVLSVNVLRILKLPPIRHYEIKIIRNGIQIGPFIGILQTMKKVRIRELDSYVKHYRKIGGAILAFSTRGLNMRKNTIQGYLYSPQAKKWKRGTYRLPDALLVKAKVTKPLHSYMRKTWADQYFNAIHFDKWQMYEWLKPHPEINRYLPKTSLCRKPEDVLSFMDKNGFSSAYLKPVWGSKGRGIYKIVKKSGHYVIHYRTKDKNESLSFTHEIAFNVHIENLLKIEDHIIQQTLRLDIRQGPLNDFRIILVKDHSGCWKSIGMVARNGPIGGVVGNRSSGGEILPADQLLQKSFQLSSRQAASYQNKMYDIAIKAAYAIDHASQRTMGRYGVDIGLDQDKNLWLLEVNNRNPNDFLPAYIGRKDLLYQIRLNNMLYTKYLAGFST